MKKLIAAILILNSCFVMAGDKITYQNWAIELNGQANEAYTIADASTSFGVFCAKEQCLFYLRQGLNCTSGATYPVLMNSTNVSTALTMECTLINGSMFQILKPFNEVLRATQTGDSIGFAVGLQMGTFAASRFSLLGAKPAIDRALLEAASSKKLEQGVPVKPLPSQKQGSKDLSI